MFAKVLAARNFHTLELSAPPGTIQTLGTTCPRTIQTVGSACGSEKFKPLELPAPPGTIQTLGTAYVLEYHLCPVKLST